MGSVISLSYLPYLVKQALYKFPKSGTEKLITDVLVNSKNKSLSLIYKIPA